MKTILIYIILAISVLGFVACEDELNQSPITDKSADNFFQTEIEIESAVNGVYATLQGFNLYGVYIPIIGEIPSDNTFAEVPANDGGRYGQLDEFTTVTENPVITNLWRDSYRGIQRANTVLNRIEEVEFEDENVKSSRIGEMKFIRALLYFNLVRLYGDIPLVIEETSNPNDFFGQARTPTADVYTQIITDLDEVITVLPKSQSEAGRVTQTAAQSLLGKVHLTLGNYNEAINHLGAVKASGLHSLVANPADIFTIENENNEEIIFAVQFASGLNGNSEGSRLFQQTAPSGTVNEAKGHNLPTVTLYNLFDPNDLRFDAFLGVTEEGIPFSKKLAEPATDPRDGGSDMVVIRYADVLLMLAEAQNETGNTQAALENLNAVRTRAGLSNATARSQTDIRDAIALERRFELVSEGHRWFDLLRTNQAISVMNAWFAEQGRSTRIDENDLLMPIPQSQIDTDPAITQNSGY
ncbi:MAG: RagB/SusD family nutrient uptake outer membrane protein [Cyclobacteriaceae bacterium]